MRSRKGQSPLDEAGWLIGGVLAVMVIVPATFFYVSILLQYNGNLVDVPSEIEAEIIVNRFLYQCFSSDKWEIDLAEFTEENLDKCYNTKSIDDINFGLKIGDKRIITNYYGGKDDFELKKYVEVYDQGVKNEEWLIVGVQT